MAASDEYRDALLVGGDGVVGAAPHRRGAGINPGNRFETVRLHVLGEEIDRRMVEQAGEGGADGERVRVERTVFRDKTRTIINRVTPLSDVPFDWTVNPYRGCEHGCVYCFARPYHEYLGFSAGLDFETKLMAKPDAPELLRAELSRASWAGEPIVMSAITDVYQAVEHEMRITRGCLEVMAECGQPVSTMTKSALVLRDADLWAKLAAANAGRVTVTLVTLDADLAQKLEPRASSPTGRLRVIRELVRAGVPVHVNVAPIVPGLTDAEMPRILGEVAAAGATSAAYAMLRLPHQVKDIFLDWLKRSVHEERAKKVEAQIRDMRGGKLYESTLGVRHSGRGTMAAQVAQMWDVYTRKYGLNRNMRKLSSAGFRRPGGKGSVGQMGLWS